MRHAAAGQLRGSAWEKKKKKITLQKAKCTSAIVCTGASVCSGFRAARMPPCVRSACAGMHISFCACAEIRASRRECERTRGVGKKMKSHPTRVSKPPGGRQWAVKSAPDVKRARVRRRAHAHTPTPTHMKTQYTDKRTRGCQTSSFPG